MSNELLVFLAAMTPLGELRLSIPLGLVTFKLPSLLVFALSVTGNMVPIPFIFIFLRKSGSWLEQQPNLLGSLFRWRAGLIRTRYGPQVAKYGTLFLVLLVAVPLPVTGAWTGALVVWALDLPFKRGVIAIAVGVLIAGVLVTTASTFGIDVLSRLV